jgi:hypothetical protein
MKTNSPYLNVYSQLQSEIHRKLGPENKTENKTKTSLNISSTNRRWDPNIAILKK